MKAKLCKERSEITCDDVEDMEVVTSEAPGTSSSQSCSKYSVKKGEWCRDVFMVRM